MKLPTSSIRALIKDNERTIVILSLFFISIIAFVYFYQHSQLLLIGDSLSRLNISRKIVDNLTPGFAQIGSVWLPLPQILMLPFIWNNFLWHSGIAGSIVNMTSYIIGGYFLFQSLRVLTKSFVASLLSLSIYALNINLLYLQATAMSEPIFLCSVSIATYYFILWVKSYKNMHHLIFAGLAISAATLIRYEALALLFSSIPMVFAYVLYKTKNYHFAESNTILYTSLAGFGFLLWTIYLTIIFGDPLYWKNFYIGTHVAGDGNTQLHTFTFHLTFVEAFVKYFATIVWMNGLIPTILAILALPILAYKSYKQKTFYFLPVLLTSSMFVFMLLTIHKNTPIEQPVLNLSNILNTETYKFPEFNIRYGLLMLPIITLLCSYLFSIRQVAFRIFIFALLCVQFITYYYPGIVLIFQLPINTAGETIKGTPRQLAMMRWMKSNYQTGLIMISALKNDPQMFQLDLDYKKYIHEGTGFYWKESQTNPQKYATWIIFDSYNKDDQVTKYLKDSPSLSLYYNRVYDDDGMYIYKIKTKTDIVTKNL